MKMTLLSLILCHEKKALSFAFCAASAAVFAQGLTPFMDDNGRYGNKNDKDSVVIQPKYDFAQDFRKGHAVVFLNGKTGASFRRGFRSSVSITPTRTVTDTGISTKTAKRSFPSYTKPLRRLKTGKQTSA